MFDRDGGLDVLEGCWMECLTGLLGELFDRDPGINECQGCWMKCLTWTLNKKS